MKKRYIIYACITVAVLTLFGVAIFYLTKLKALEEYSKRVDHSYRIILQITKLEKNLLDAETGQRGFIITQDSTFLKPYSQSYNNINDIFLELDTLTKVNQNQQSHLDTLKALIQTTTVLLKENMNEFSKQKDFNDEFEKGRYYMDKIRTSMENLKKEETDNLILHDNNKQRYSESSKITSYLLLIMAFIMIFLATYGILTYLHRSLRYQEKLSERNYKLKILNKEILDLTFASSHNLQEPMRKIQLMIDKAQSTQLNEYQLAENLNRIKEIYASQQLTNNIIVKYYDLLNTSTEKEAIPLNDYLNQFIDTNKWKYAVNIKIDKLPVIQADKYQIDLLFHNIIENAVDFNTHNPELQIDIYAIDVESLEIKNFKKGNRKYHAICIADNGIGIDHKHHSKIFELFQKIDNSHQFKDKKGMGLSFCKRIMLNHGGWILAENNRSKGMKIVVLFPIT